MANLGPPRRGKKTMAERAYAQLKRDILAGRWKKTFPGSRVLAAELRMTRIHVSRAIKRLTLEGLLQKIGKGYSLIVCPEVLIEKPVVKRRLEAAILMIVPIERVSANEQRTIFAVLREVEQCGFIGKILMTHFDGWQNRPAARAWLRKQNADIFLPYIFPTDLLEYLDAGGAPVYAIGGGVLRVKKTVAAMGDDFSQPMGEVVRAFIDAGHRRIVAILPEVMRMKPNAATRMKICDALQSAGITPSSYNIPDWEYSGKGLRTLLESLFSVTPPTAILAFDLNTACGIFTFLNSRRLRVPEDVSVVIGEDVQELSWLHPEKTIGTVKTNLEAGLGDLRRWLHNVERGKIGRKRFITPGILKKGECVAPPPSVKRVA